MRLKKFCQQCTYCVKYGTCRNFVFSPLYTDTSGQTFCIFLFSTKIFQFFLCQKSISFHVVNSSGVCWHHKQPLCKNHEVAHIFCCYLTGGLRAMKLTVLIKSVHKLQAIEVLTDIKHHTSCKEYLSSLLLN